MFQVKGKVADFDSILFHILLLLSDCFNRFQMLMEATRMHLLYSLVSFPFFFFID